MDERFRKQVRQFLSGTLGRDEMLAVLDRVKSSEECRSYLEEQARMASSRHKPHYAVKTGAPLQTYGGPARSRTTSHSDEAEQFVPTSHTGMRRRKIFTLRRTIMLGIVLFSTLWALNNNKSDASEKEAPNPKELLIAHALMEGSPYAVSPRGVMETRPITLTAIVPAGNDSVRLVFLNDGKPLWDHTFTQGSTGVEVDSRKVASLDGQLPAVEFLIPFPSSDELQLEKGKRYFYFLELLNGRQSAPQSLDIR